MAIRYINPTGSNTAPYDSLATGATSIYELLVTDGVVLADGDITYLNSDSGTYGYIDEPGDLINTGLIKGTLTKDPLAANRPRVQVSGSSNWGLIVDSNDVIIKDIWFTFSAYSQLQKTLTLKNTNSYGGLIVDSCQFGAGDGVRGGIQIDGDHSDIVIKNNIFLGGEYGGLRAIGSGSASNIKVLNNTFYQTGYSFEGSIAIENYEDPTVLNNIILEGSSNYGRRIFNCTGTINVDYNIVNGYGSNPFDVLAQNTNEFDIDPMMITGDPDRFHLLPGSPAINGGTDTEATVDFDGVPRPAGFFDVGAIEEPTPKTYYINPTGSNTAPYDSAATGANSFHELFVTNAVVLNSIDTVYLVGDNGVIEEPDGFNDLTFNLKGTIDKDPLSTNKPVVHVVSENWQFSIRASNTSVKNIVFDCDQGNSAFVGIHILSDISTENVTIDACKFISSNPANASDPFLEINGTHSDLKITNCIFVDSKGSAVYISGVYDPMGLSFANNIFYNCANVELEYVLNIEGYKDSVVINNIISGGGVGGGRNVSSFSGSYTVDYNIVHSVSGTAFGGESQGSNELTSDPQFTNPGTGDFSLQVTSPAINSGFDEVDITTDYNGDERPQGSYFDMGAIESTVDNGPTIRYINPIGSNTAPYNTPATGATSLDEFFNTNGIVLKAGDITYLVGDNGNIVDTSGSEFSIKGLFTKDPASTNRPIIELASNSVLRQKSNCTIKDIDFILQTSNPGVAIGVFNGPTFNTTVDSCLFDGFLGYHISFGGSYTHDDVVIKSCVFKNSHNSAVYIQGGYAPDGLNIINNTFYNCANAEGQVINALNYVNVNIVNNIISGGGFDGGRFAENLTGTVVVDYNIVHNVAGDPFGSYYPQEANELTSDPLFTNAGSGDFTLQVGSPARNAGTATTATEDFNGETRPQGSGFDMGAFEFLEGDAVPPEWESGYPQEGVVTGTTAEVLVKTNENGFAYAVALPFAAAAPTSAQVRDGQDSTSMPVPSGHADSVALVAFIESSLMLTNLSSETAYKIYVVAEDEEPNLQTTPEFITVTTPDVTAPTFEVAPSVSGVTPSSATVNMQINEAGTGYVVAVLDGDTAPTAAEVKAGQKSGGGAPTASGNTALLESTNGTVNLSGLPAVDLDVYVVAEDDDLNLQTSPTSINLNLLPPVFAVGFPNLSDVDVDTATVNVKSTQNGTAYMVVVPNDAAAPSVAQVKLGQNASSTPVASGLSGNVALVANVANTIPVTNLTPATLYDVYVVIVNASDIPSTNSPVKLDLDLDITVPTYADGYPKLSNNQPSSIDVVIKTNEAGITYAVAVSDDTAAPTKAQVKLGQDGNSNPAVSDGSAVLVANTEATIVLSGLDASLNYDIYVIAEDESGNSASPVKLDLNRTSVQKNNRAVDVKTNYGKSDRSSRRINAATFESLPSRWAVLTNGNILVAVTTGVPAKVHKFPITDSISNPYETQDVKVGRIATIESIGSRVTVNLNGYVPGVLIGDKLVVSVEAGEEGKLKNTRDAMPGTYEVVARCEYVDNDAETMSWVLTSPEYITIT